MRSLSYDTDISKEDVISIQIKAERANKINNLKK